MSVPCSLASWLPMERQRWWFSPETASDRTAQYLQRCQGLAVQELQMVSNGCRKLSACALNLLVWREDG